MAEVSSARTDVEASTLDDIRREVEALRAEVVQLRREMAGEVRTRRLVVVDDHGRELIATRVTGTATSIEIKAPGGEHPATVYIGAAWGEFEDDQGRPAGGSSVMLGASGIVGVEVAAYDVDGGPAFEPSATDPTGGALRPAVVGSIDVFDHFGDPGIQITNDGVGVRR